jgi:Lon protease-like protein
VELPIENQSRRAIVSYDRYVNDIVCEADFSFDRDRLMIALRGYCKRRNINLDLKELASMSNERLITLLMMICPFDQNEKQALLETVGYVDQSTLITRLMEMNSVNNQVSSTLYH